MRTKKAKQQFGNSKIMEKIEITDYDSCIVCSEYMGTFKNELQVSTAYSEKTILDIIGEFSLLRNLSQKLTTMIL